MRAYFESAVDDPDEKNWMPEPPNVSPPSLIPVFAAVVFRLIVPVVA